MLYTLILILILINANAKQSRIEQAVARTERKLEKLLEDIRHD